MRKVVIGVVTVIMVLMMLVVAQASENDRLSEYLTPRIIDKNGR